MPHLRINLKTIFVNLSPGFHLVESKAAVERTGHLCWRPLKTGCC